MLSVKAVKEERRKIIVQIQVIVINDESSEFCFMSRKE